jgi:hypothetical protein
MRRKVFVILTLIATAVWLSGCAMMAPESTQKPYRISPQGTVIYEEEFEFAPPPLGWKMLLPETGGDINFGFMRQDGGPFPSMSTFAYDEEPFGCSTQFEGREKEFFKRFLFNAIVQFQVLEKKKVQVVGGEGLQVDVEGKDPIKGEKVRARVIFGKRGDRVIGFYITQWRPIAGTYDMAAFDDFDRFVKSFKFLKKSFYETL